MRAITGAVLSSSPCSLAKAAHVLALFADSAASHLPSPDAVTYLRTATDATSDHHIFRLDLRRLQHQGGTFEADEKHIELQSASNQDDGERNPDDNNSPASEKKKRKKKMKEDKMRNAQNKETVKAPDGGLQAFQPEEEINKGSNDKKNRKKHIKQEEEARSAREVEKISIKDDVTEQEINKGSNDKKKNRKKHIKQEEEARGAREVEKIAIKDGVTEQGTPSKENKRKKNKHEKQEEDENGRNANEGDLGSGKKRKSKRRRGESNDDDVELVKHTMKKKHRKQPGN